MRKSSEYREYAEECRALARKALPGEHREQLVKLAETWDQLAVERNDLVRRHPELGLPGECEELTAAD